MGKAVVAELTERVLANVKDYTFEDGHYRGWDTFYVAAKLEVSSNTAREVIERVRLKLKAQEASKLDSSKTVSASV